MSISVIEACTMVRELTDVPVTILSEKEARVKFSAALRFHEAQEYLRPEALSAFLKELEEEEIVVVKDCFRLCIVFFLAKGEPVAIGPFVASERLEGVMVNGLAGKGQPAVPLRELTVYRSRFPVLEESRALHYAQCLLCGVYGRLVERRRRTVDYGMTYLDWEEQGEVLLPQAGLVEERYRLELEMVENIKAGKASSALRCYRQVARRSAYLRNFYRDNLDAHRVRAAITRTTARMAVMEAGLPAVLVDAVTTASSRAVFSARSVREIERLTEELIRDLCNAVRIQRDRQYSKRILCMIYAIEHRYHEGITVSDVARELEMPVDSLVKRCKQEMGITPNVFLRQTRMKQAARLLRESSLSIQEISAGVGIFDASYFSKVFRQEFGVAPSEYRGENLL